MKKYFLEFHETLSYFKENLKKTNTLSDSVLEHLNFKSGVFFSFFTKAGLSFKELHEFNYGGKSTYSVNATSNYAYNILCKTKDGLCIFDDFNADEINTKNSDLFHSYGACYKSEIYYLIHKNTSEDVLLKCFHHSNAIWHSLSIISEIKLENKKNLTTEDMKEICSNAVLVLLMAYDSEGYVIWERS